MEIILILIISIICVLVAGYVIYYIAKAVKARPKIVKAPKPAKDKKEPKVSEKPSVAEKPVMKEVEPEVQTSTPQMEEKKQPYVPSWDTEESDDEEDDLEEYRHFPGLSHSVHGGSNLSEQLSNLPDEIKVLILTNALKRPDRD